MNDNVKPLLVGGVGEINFGKQYRQGNRIYDSNAIAMCLLSQPVGNAGGFSYLYSVEETNMKEPFIVASRGRNPENPSDRTPGAPTEQRLEPNSQGICNTLTTVLKDNYVVEPNVLTPKRTDYGKAIRKKYESGEIKESRHNMTELQPRADGIANTLTTVQKDNLVAEPTLRIRKLTPKECFRLMGFDDESFGKAEVVNSNTQLYKQAGNSIVVDVLEQLFIRLQMALPDVLV